MAVPKKRTSKSKKNSRKSQWYKVAKFQAQKALSIAKSILIDKGSSFVMPNKPQEEEK
jgi:large subunit ribosomal protein L32